MIAGRIQGRTANAVKNYWNTHLRKKVLLSNDKTKPKNDSHNNKKVIENNQQTIIKSKAIKPRPWTFTKNLIISTSPRHRSSAPTSENGPQNFSEIKNWQEGLLDDGARNDQGTMINDSLLIISSTATDNYNRLDDDIINGRSFEVISEANNVGGRVIASLSSNEESTAPLMPNNNNIIGGNDDDCVLDSSCINNFSSEFCVEEASDFKFSWMDFIVNDMDLWDHLNEDKDLP